MRVRLMRVRPMRVRPMRVRPGAALLLAILVLLVVDCLLLGSLQLALLERRVADNAAAALRLRLAADNAVRAALAAWSGGVDTLAVAAPALTLLQGTTAERYGYTATIERVGGALFLLRAEAREPPPRAGRAAAALLLRPPALPPVLDVAAAALSAGAAVTIAGNLAAGSGDTCARGGDALRVTALDRIRIVSGGSVDGAVSWLAERADVTAALPRIIDALRHDALPGVELAPDPLHISADRRGVVIAERDVSIAGGVRFEGLLIAGGRLTVEENGVLVGAAHVADDVHIDGALQLNPCLVDTVIAAARLRAARPVRGRAWLPAF